MRKADISGTRVSNRKAVDALSNIPPVAAPVKRAQRIAVSQPNTQASRDLPSPAALPTVPGASSQANRIKVRSRYQALYSKLDLTKSEIDAFEKAVSEKYGQVDIFNITLGVLPREQEAAMLTTTWHALEAVVRESLGEAHVSEFRNYVAGADVRSVIDKLAVQALYANRPLTPQQYSFLTQLALEGAPQGEVRTAPKSIDWRAFDARASAILDGNQMEVWNAIRAIREFDVVFEESTKLPYRRNVRGF